MMDIDTLASKVGGEFVGGRLLATIDGKKQYLTTIGSSGSAFLNELGLKLSNELSLAPQPEPEPPVVEPDPEPKAEPPVARRGRPRKAVPVEDEEVPEQLELDI